MAEIVLTIQNVIVYAIS